MIINTYARENLTYLWILPVRWERKKVTVRRTKKESTNFLIGYTRRTPEGKEIAPGYGQLEYHDTPKHSGWLNIADIESNVMDIECRGRRFSSKGCPEKSVKAWEKRKNRKKCRIKWAFTKEKAEKKPSKYCTGYLIVIALSSYDSRLHH